MDGMSSVDAMGIVRLPSQQQPDNMKNPTSALTEEVTKQNVQPSREATGIVLGVDVHLRSYQVARKVDNLAIGPVQSFRSQTELLLWLERLKARAEQIEVVYEAGPLGYTLYRELRARGINCRVCAPDSSEQKRKRIKTNSIDARALAGRLYSYLNGDERALRLVRIPSMEEERRRLRSRQHDQLVQERKRLAARGNSLLLAAGYGSIKHWWRPKSLERLTAVLEPELQQMLELWVGLLRLLDEKIALAKAALMRRQTEPRPKGLGALSMEQLESELLSWQRYSSGRKIACLTGMIPSQWSTGEAQRLGSITKVGLGPIRRIMVEAVWRMKGFQPHYEPFQKWRAALEGQNRAHKKKAVVAIGRQLAVDLWRLKTRRVTAQQLKLIMVGGSL